MNSNKTSVKLESRTVGDMNGNNTNVFLHTPGQPSMPDNFIFQTVDPSIEDEDDSDSDVDRSTGFGSCNDHLMKKFSVSGAKPGKKTKGRVKIKMEFIENKLRRYTTFSKRKTGIMKKVSLPFDFYQVHDNHNISFGNSR